jgi:murein DD-endopeptidase MepM/ murein hydrolase activator NlpD
VCTELGPYCQDGRGECYWCFAGGNVVVIRHRNTSGVFATRYDHFRKDSIVVKPGDMVKAGDKLGLVGSAGNSTRPHLHFEVWGKTYYDPVEPFAGECGPNRDTPLWARDPPWSK